MGGPESVLNKSAGHLECANTLECSLFGSGGGPQARNELKRFVMCATAKDHWMKPGCQGLI